MARRSVRFQTEAGRPTELSPAAADAEAALISPDGYSIRTATKGAEVGWIAPPHFYKAGKLIVLYVGESEVVTVVLERVLGPQFAGR